MKGKNECYKHEPTEFPVNTAGEITNWGRSNYQRALKTKTCDVGSYEMIGQPGLLSALKRIVEGFIRWTMFVCLVECREVNRGKAIGRWDDTDTH